MSTRQLPKNTAIYLVAAAMDRDLGTARAQEFRWKESQDGLKTGSLVESDYVKGTEAANMLLAANRYAILFAKGEHAPVETVHGAEMKAALDFAQQQRVEGKKFDPLQVLRTTEDFAYHCDANPVAWVQSPACSFLDHLRHAAHQAIPGYRDRPFGIPREWADLPDLTEGNTVVPDAPNLLASYILYSEPRQPGSGKQTL